MQASDNMIVSNRCNNIDFNHILFQWCPTITLTYADLLDPKW